jgi:uncharacterized membrane protein
MKKILFLIALLLTQHYSYSCTTCNKELQKGIYDSTFYPNLLTMLSAFIVLAIMVIVLSRLTLIYHKKAIKGKPHIKHYNPVPLSSTSMILGIGLGGFVDGILFHQVLQWHEMLSNKIPVATVLGKSINMFWDGVFHFFCLCVVFTGIILLWKLLFRVDIDRSKKLFIGGLLSGWGLFNVVEGIIDHHLLKLHNVKEVTLDPAMWNYLFLGVSVIMALIGLGLIYKKGLRSGVRLND